MCAWEPLIRKAESRLAGNRGKFLGRQLQTRRPPQKGASVSGPSSGTGASESRFSAAASLVAARCGASRLQNRAGCGEDTGRALVRDFLLCLEPVLNVAT